MIEPILANTVLTVALSGGIAATAATATRPAASAYSTRSCPRVSLRNCLRNFLIGFRGATRAGSNLKLTSVTFENY